MPISDFFTLCKIREGISEVFEYFFKFNLLYFCRCAVAYNERLKFEGLNPKHLVEMAWLK